MLESFRPLRNDLGFSGENCTPWMDIPVGVARQVDVGRRYEIRSGKEGHDTKNVAQVPTSSMLPAGIRAHHLAFDAGHRRCQIIIFVGWKNSAAILIG